MAPAIAAILQFYLQLSAPPGETISRKRKPFLQRRSFFTSIHQQLAYCSFVWVISTASVGSFVLADSILSSTGSKSGGGAPWSPSTMNKIFDSHLHVWDANGPYVNGSPPVVVRDVASTSQYLAHARTAGVGKALLVQPANYGRDHTYLDEARRGNKGNANDPTGRGTSSLSGEPTTTAALDVEDETPTTTQLLGMYLATDLLGKQCAPVDKQVDVVAGPPSINTPLPKNDEDDRKAEGQNVENSPSARQASSATQTVEATKVAELWARARQGYRGVRFNPALFPGQTLDNECARALYHAAGEAGLAVGVMAFGGILPHIAALRKLLTAFPKTKLILDHFGFFRQPATGGVQDDEDDAAALASTATAADRLPRWAEELLANHAGKGTGLEEDLYRSLSPKNDEAAFEAVLNLVRDFPASVFVKLSAFFRVSKFPFPHIDVRPRVLALLQAAGGGHRLLWGSDFPYVLSGGHDQTALATQYPEAVRIFHYWNENAETSPDLMISEGDLAWIQWKTAESLFSVTQHPTSSTEQDQESEPEGALRTMAILERYRYSGCCYRIFA
ncbi:unnamed protein product [Amoebophrya sp. A120]|nr:unnamed protein product [Amoebophrya sp. A120]|eukprot:GSA120T00021810001.1